MAYSFENPPPLSLIKNTGLFVARVLRTNQSPTNLEQHRITHEPRVLDERNLSGFPFRAVVFADTSGFHTLGVLDISAGRHELKPHVLTFNPKAVRDTDTTGVHAVLPLGPINPYHKNFLRKRGAPPEFIFYAHANGKQYGSDTVVDRFDGANGTINPPYSGGLVIENGTATIVNQTEFAQKAQEGKPAAQLMYTWDKTNKDALLEQVWHHRGSKDQVPVKTSLANWSWYLEGNGKTYFVAPKFHLNEEFVFESINTINDSLMPDTNWKVGLSVFGLGGGFVIKDGSKTKHASHPEPFMHHNNPLYLVATP